MHLNHRLQNLDGLGHEDFLFSNSMISTEMTIGLDDGRTKPVKVLDQLDAFSQITQ